jgi:TnpA family transposase
MVFGLFTMRGYNFSPRFKDLNDQRFWRAEMPGAESGGYGPLEDLARNKVNLNKVTMHWPDMLRVAGSLVTGQVRAYDLLRMFGREGRPTPLGQAFAEYGRIAKTLHLLRVVDPVDDTYRRQMNRQLTVQESRHKLARDICKRGQIMQGIPNGAGGPTRGARPGPQCRRALDNPLPRRRRRPPASPAARGAGA